MDALLKYRRPLQRPIPLHEACGNRRMENRRITAMYNGYVSREEAAGTMLYDAINLCGQREQVRRGLKVQVNNLTRSVHERKALYADLRAKEDELTAQIEQVLPHLEPSDAQRLHDQYDV